MVRLLFPDTIQPVKKAVLSETIIALLLMLSQYKAFSKLFELNQFLLLIVPMTIR